MKILRDIDKTLFFSSRYLLLGLPRWFSFLPRLPLEVLLILLTRIKIFFSFFTVAEKIVQAIRAQLLPPLRRQLRGVVQMTAPPSTVAVVTRPPRTAGTSATTQLHLIPHHPLMLKGIY